MSLKGEQNTEIIADWAQKMGKTGTAVEPQKVWWV